VAGRTLSALECQKQLLRHTLVPNRPAVIARDPGAHTSGSSACRAIQFPMGAGRGVQLEGRQDENRPVVVSGHLRPTPNSTCQDPCKCCAQTLHLEWRKSPTRHQASKPINCSGCPRTRCLPESRTEVQHLRAPLRCVGPFSFVMRPRKCNTRACRTRVSSILRS